MIAALFRAPVVTGDDAIHAVLEQRSRALEQVMRIYAVVMGVAVTEMIDSAIRIVRADQFPVVDGIMFVIAPAFSFASLIFLFYLGVERMMDVRYLRADSPHPSRHGLFIDLSILATQSAWFVILANSFPNPEVAGGGIRSANDWKAILPDFQARFAWKLLAFHGLNLVFLLVQLVRLLWRGEPPLARFAHVTWFVLDLSVALVLSFMLLRDDTPGITFGLAVNDLCLALLAAHAVHFVADFGLTFPFYFPPQRIGRPPNHARMTTTPTK